MEIRFDNVIYKGQPYAPDDLRHEIEIPQIRGRGADTKLIRVKEKDLDDLSQLVGETLSFIGYVRKGIAAEKCIFGLIREQEPNPAKND